MRRFLSFFYSLLVFSGSFVIRDLAGGDFIYNSYLLNQPGLQTLFFIFIGLALFSFIVYERMKGALSWKDCFKSIENHCWIISLSNANIHYLLLVWLLIPLGLQFIIFQIFPLPCRFYIPRFVIGTSFAFYIMVAKGL